jgi:4-hydroxybenzoate polyprenyltransferase
MSAWLTFTKERLPLPVYLVVAGGAATSGQYVGGSATDGRSIVIAMVGVLLFLVELRVMDELKDYDKDVEAHPERPLPRGLITMASIKRVILAGAVIMLLYCGVVYGLAGGPAALLYFASTAFLLLMFKEFFIGTWLSKAPILYAVTHQVVMLPLVAFAVTLTHPQMWKQQETWMLGTCILGAFFTYEICRKLDPKAPRVLETYLVHHGRVATVFFLLCTTSLAAWGAHVLGLGLLLWPAEALVIVGLPILFLAPARYKIVEALATLSLVVHL